MAVFLLGCLQANSCILTGYFITSFEIFFRIKNFACLFTLILKKSETMTLGATVITFFRNCLCDAHKFCHQKIQFQKQTFLYITQNASKFVRTSLLGMKERQFSDEKYFLFTQTFWTFHFHRWVKNFAFKNL